jgi:hypothetical protein
MAYSDHKRDRGFARMRIHSLQEMKGLFRLVKKHVPVQCLDAICMDCASPEGIRFLVLGALLRGRIQPCGDHHALGHGRRAGL